MSGRKCFCFRKLYLPRDFLKFNLALLKLNLALAKFNFSSAKFNSLLASHVFLPGVSILCSPSYVVQELWCKVCAISPLDGIARQPVLRELVKVE